MSDICQNCGRRKSESLPFFGATCAECHSDIASEQNIREAVAAKLLAVSRKRPEWTSWKFFSSAIVALPTAAILGFVAVIFFEQTDIESLPRDAMFRHWVFLATFWVLGLISAVASLACLILFSATFIFGAIRLVSGK